MRKYYEYIYIPKQLFIHEIKFYLLLTIEPFKFLMYIWNFVVITNKLEDVDVEQLKSISFITFGWQP